MPVTTSTRPPAALMNMLMKKSLSMAFFSVIAVVGFILLGSARFDRRQFERQRLYGRAADHLGGAYESEKGFGID